MPVVGVQLFSWQRRGPDKPPGQSWQRQSAHLPVLLAEAREPVSKGVKLAVRVEGQVKDTKALPWRKSECFLSDEPAAVPDRWGT